MRTVLARAFGPVENLEICEQEEPAPAPGHVRIAAHSGHGMARMGRGGRMRPLVRACLILGEAHINGVEFSRICPREKCVPLAFVKGQNRPVDPD